MPIKKKTRYNEYMATYMREYRKMEREAIQKARQMLGLSTKVRTHKKRKKQKGGK